MMRIGKFAGLALGVLLAVASRCLGVEVGESIPDFSLQTFDGRVISRSTLAGRPALIVFWNTWCDECRRDLPKINQLARGLGAQGKDIVAINTGLNDSEKNARSYWKKYGYLFPTGYDASFQIRKVFRVPGVPALYLVDSRGIVRYRGSSPPDDLARRLRK